jgi:hypothetical protein
MWLWCGCGRTSFDPQPNTNVDAAMIAIDSPVVVNVDAANGPDAMVDRANIGFVTSTNHKGNLGGPTGADAVCASRAADVGLTGEFIALVRAPNRPDLLPLLDTLLGGKP